MDQQTVLNNAYKNKNKLLNEYRIFLDSKGYSLYSLTSIAICLELKKDIIKNKITIIMLVIVIFEFFITFCLSLIYNSFFGIPKQPILILLGIFVLVSIPFYFINNIIRLYYYKKCLCNNIRYICFTNDYKVVVSKRENNEFVIEKKYNHFIDIFITNIKWTSSFKIMDENNKVHEVYEIISKKVNSYLIPTGIHAMYNDYDFWSKNSQLEYFKKNGSNLEYVDEEYIRDNCWSFKPTPSRF